MRFGDYKRCLGIDNVINYHDVVVKVPDHAVRCYDPPPGLDADLDVHGTQLYTFHHGAWWTWPVEIQKQIDYYDNHRIQH